MTVTGTVYLTPCPQCDGRPRLGAHGVGHSDTPPALANVTRLPARAMTERQLQESITDLCRLLGLYVYHTRDSRGSAKGFPDLVIMGTIILYVELKTARGKLTIDQVFVRDRCRKGGGHWALWRPEHWHSGEIRQTLTVLAGRPPVVAGEVIRPAALTEGGGRG